MPIFRIKEDLGFRLKKAREALGLSQKDLAAKGGVTRVTQAGYEAESTDPNTGYLKAIQEAGIDLQYVLTGSFSLPSSEQHPEPPAIDWERLRAAYEDVEFFCQRVAPSCPSKYRWQLVAKLYQGDVKLGTAAPQDSDDSSKQTIAFLTKLWESYV